MRLPLAILSHQGALGQPFRKTDLLANFSTGGNFKETGLSEEIIDG
jgi:hypothetical protein